MGKCYCDYCDVFLTNDSVAVRKQHNEGNRHKYNVCEYYRQYVGQQLQQQMDDIVAQFELDVARGLLRPTYGLPPPSKTGTDTLLTASGSAEVPNTSADGPSADAQSPGSRSDGNPEANSSSKPDEDSTAEHDSEPGSSEKNPDPSVDVTETSNVTSANDKDVPVVHDPVSVNAATEAIKTELPIIPTSGETNANQSSI